MSDQLRQLAAQGVIGLAVCIGGYLMLVAPVRDDVQRARAEAEAAREQLREIDFVQERVDVIAAALERVKTEADLIARQGRMARDHRDLFAAVMRLAAESDVRVDQLTPMQSQQRGRQTQERGDIAVSYRMSIVAEYGSLGMFLRNLQHELGYSVVRSVRIVPAADRGNTVHATIETEHFYFDPAPRPDDRGGAHARVQEGRR